MARVTRSSVCAPSGLKRPLPPAVVPVSGDMEQRPFRADERLNELNDRDDMWGPLLFLRPARHQPLTVTRVLTLAASLGAFFGMLGNVVLGLLLSGGAGGKPPVWLMPALFTGMYFVCGQLSLAAAWNRRARLLSRRLDWSQLTGRPLPPTRDDQQAAE